MAQTRTNHVTYAFVTGPVDRAATTILDPASATYIAEGEVALGDLTGTLVDPSTSATYTGKDKMRIYYRKDSGVYKSPVIDINSITNYKVNTCTPATNKVMYIGYNGTSGDIEDNSYTVGTTYMVNLRKLGITDHYYDNSNFHKSFGYYYSASSLTRVDVIMGLVKNGVDNFNDNHGADTFVKIEAVSSSASSAASASCSFVEGSKVVVGGAGHGITAGDILRPSGAGTTNPIYCVESVDGNNIYLQVPYQGDSETLTPHILSAALSSDYGLKLTGRNKKFDSNSLRFWYDVSDFDVSLKNFDCTDTTVSDSADLGVGTWQEVAQLERECQDYEGQTSHKDNEIPNRKTYFVEDDSYDMLVLQGYDDSVDSLTGSPKSKFTIIVPINTSYDQGDAAGGGGVTPGIATAIDLWTTTNLSGTYNQDANVT